VDRSVRRLRLPVWSCGVRASGSFALRRVSCGCATDRRRPSESPTVRPNPEEDVLSPGLADHRKGLAAYVTELERRDEAGRW